MVLPMDGNCWASQHCLGRRRLLRAPASSSSAPFVDVACCWLCSSSPAIGAALFSSSYPLWARSFPLWLLFSIAVPIMHRVVLDLDHCLLAACLRIIQPSSTDMFLESAGFTQVLVCLSACHALRDALMALHEFLVGELFANVQHAHSRAVGGLLD